MKKYIGIIAVITALVGYSAYAQITQTSEGIEVMINDDDFKGEVIEQVNKIDADIEDLASAIVVNTNANVVVTNTTPAFVGQVLVTPNSTNVWTEAGTGATNSYLLRAAVATGTAVGNWAKIATDQ